MSRGIRDPGATSCQVRRRARMKGTQRVPIAEGNTQHPIPNPQMLRALLEAGSWKLGVVVLSVPFLIALLVQAQQTRVADLEATAFVCPMHPDYTLDIEGRCPRCG